MIKKILYPLSITTAIAMTTAPTVYAEQPPGEYGAVVTFIPPQAGLRAEGVSVLPWVQKEFDKGWYFIVRKGFGKYVVNSNTTKVGIGLWLDMGRRTSDHVRLKHLKTIKRSPAVNVNWQTQLGGANSLSGFVETSVREHKGTRAQFAFRRNLSANTRSMVFVNGEVYAQYVDKKYADAYYSVTAAEATASEFSGAYSASGGIDRFGVRLNVQKNFSEKLYIKGTLSMGRTAGPAKASPISDRSSYTGLAIVLGSYF